ncbi:MAG: polysaccharide deacetylase family protein [Flavobacteriales bacterium]|nr:MAG: polysaccharide deacetylase family protein [Flavobacteriales bacterium]
MSAGPSQYGSFVISLDLELMWGVRDHRTIADYGAHVRGVKEAIPAMLDLFDEFGVRATFATVGLLFKPDKQGMLSASPALKPSYADANLSPFNGHFGQVGQSEADDPHHFGTSPLHMIAARRQHEIATHTWSHYYCLEPGQTVEQFKADLACANTVAKEQGHMIRSIVFPRNQYAPTYLEACAEQGLKCYRGNEDHWVHRPVPDSGRTPLRRAIRLLDHYVNVTGHHTPRVDELKGTLPVNVPASRFLRPVSKQLGMLEPLRSRRITKSMTNAAERHGIYHLWWHPHNFGVDLQDNIAFLRKALEHFRSLERTKGMRSETMWQVAQRIEPSLA